MKSQVAGDNIKQKSKRVGEGIKQKSDIAEEALKISGSKIRDDFRLKQGYAGHVLKQKTESTRKTIKVKANRALLLVQATSADAVGSARKDDCIYKERPEVMTNTGSDLDITNMASRRPFSTFECCITPQSQKKLRSKAKKAG